MPKFPIKAFLDSTDIQEVRLISANIDEDRIKPYIFEAQRRELRDLIGDELYLAMQNDYDEGTKEFSIDRFTNLWYGAEYNFNSRVILYEGLWKGTAYYAYGRFLNNQQLNATRFGVKSLQNEFSEDITSVEIRMKAREAKSIAENYYEDAERFLQSVRVAGNLVYPEINKNDRRQTSDSFYWLPVYPGALPGVPSKSGTGTVTTGISNIYDLAIYDVSTYQ